MSMINCGECGREISSKAQTCLNCGCPVDKYNHISDEEFCEEFVATYKNHINKKSADIKTLSFGTAIVFFLIPIVGLIVYAVNISTDTEYAKKSLLPAIFGIVFSTLIFMLNYFI